jgi:carbamoyltransferase
MNIWGISANSHDAAISVWHDKELKFAAHSERYSGIKNDGDLCRGILNDAEEFGRPDLIVWYEKPLLKTIRQLYAGQGWRWQENNVRQYLNRYNLYAPVKIMQHHHSHAAAGYYTSGFDNATVIVIDAIGEFECFTIWEGQGNDLKKVYSQSYPHSIGIWFSAMTQRCGLKPNEEEYILMGMAAYGNPQRFKQDIYNDFFKSTTAPKIRFKHNLHKGCLWWRPELISLQDIYDIAAATQEIYMELLHEISDWASSNLISDNLVLMGGCALNCVANSAITHHWDNVWIMPNPGDAGSSVGAVAAYLGEHVRWPGPYLGTDMGDKYPVEATIDVLKTQKIVGVASGRAEFGPRALGHRSLLADPRGSEIKDTVNAIKRRQKFRPFAPAILEEHVHEYFDMPEGIDSSPFMQFVAECKRPEEFPAIIHADGTSRVQTVGVNDSPGFRKLLENWYQETGCPMLLNTSLNIKGMPMVNTAHDAHEFYVKYNVPVLS